MLNSEGFGKCMQLMSHGFDVEYDHEFGCVIVGKSEYHVLIGFEEINRYGYDVILNVINDFIIDLYLEHKKEGIV